MQKALPVLALEPTTTALLLAAATDERPMTGDVGTRKGLAGLL